MSSNIFFAVHAEHKQRTGHDVFKRSRFSTLPIECDVCLYLKAEKQALDKAEQKYYDEIRTKEVEHDEQ